MSSRIRTHWFILWGTGVLSAESGPGKIGGLYHKVRLTGRSYVKFKVRVFSVIKRFRFTMATSAEHKTWLWSRLCSNFRFKISRALHSFILLLTASFQRFSVGEYGIAMPY